MLAWSGGIIQPVPFTEEGIWGWQAGKGKKVREFEVPVHELRPAGVNAQSPGVCASKAGTSVGPSCWQSTGTFWEGPQALGGHR